MKRSSRNRFEEAVELEESLIDLLRETAPDMGVGDKTILHLRRANQRLKDEGNSHALPEILWRMIRGISSDGRGEGGVVEASE